MAPVTAEKRPASLISRDNVGTRRERRAMPRYQWLTSRPHKEILARAEQSRERVEHMSARLMAA
jgi:hypothetical protein